MCSTDCIILRKFYHPRADSAFDFALWRLLRMTIIFGHALGGLPFLADEVIELWMFGDVAGDERADDVHL